MSKSQPADLRYLMVQTVAELVGLGTAELTDGARCVVRTRHQNQPGNREYVFTRRVPDTITFVAHIAEGANVIQSPNGGYWVAAQQLGGITLNGTTPVVISNVYVSANGTAATGFLALMRITAGTANGHITSTLSDNSFTVVSDEATDDGALLYSLNSVF